MGAWNYQVFGNDEGCEFMYRILQPLRKLLKKKFLYDYEYNDLRAAAEIIIKLSPCYTFDREEIIDPLTAKLTNILTNASWLQSWNRPSILKKDLNRQIKDLLQISKITNQKLSTRKIPRFHQHFPQND